MSLSIVIKVEIAKEIHKFGWIGQRTDIKEKYLRTEYLFLKQAGSQ